MPRPAYASSSGAGVGQVGFGYAEYRIEACVIGGNQAPVDQSRGRSGFGDGRYDHQLIRIGDHDPLHRIVVVGGAA